MLAPVVRAWDGRDAVVVLSGSSESNLALIKPSLKASRNLLQTLLNNCSSAINGIAEKLLGRSGNEIQILEVRQHRNNVQSYYSYGKWQGRLYLWRRRSRHDGVFLCQD